MPRISDKLINKIKSYGLRVWMRDRDDSYLLFTDRNAVKIGYLQNSGLDAISMSTVHKPNYTSGTGFGMFQHVDEDDLSREDLDACFCLYPQWASSASRDSVRKWKGMEEFRAADKFNAAYLER